MFAVAERPILAMLAAAQGHPTFFIDSEFMRCKIAALVGADAERLAGTFSAGAEPVVACFQFKGDG